MSGDTLVWIGLAALLAIGLYGYWNWNVRFNRPRKQQLQGMQRPLYTEEDAARIVAQAAAKPKRKYTRKPKELKPSYDGANLQAQQLQSQERNVGKAEWPFPTQGEQLTNGHDKHPEQTLPPETYRDGSEA